MPLAWPIAWWTVRALPHRFLSGMGIPYDFFNRVYRKAYLWATRCWCGGYSLGILACFLSETWEWLVAVDEGWLIRFANLANE